MDNDKQGMVSIYLNQIFKNKKLIIKGSRKRFRDFIFINFLKKNYKFISLLVLANLFYPDTSYAYFDPGTGSFILQAIVALFSTTVIYLGYPIRLIKKLINKLKSLKKTKKDNLEGKKIIDEK